MIFVHESHVPRNQQVEKRTHVSRVRALHWHGIAEVRVQIMLRPEFSQGFLITTQVVLKKLRGSHTSTFVI